MNLTLDIGNTRSKAALFDKDRLIETETFNQENSQNEFESYLKANPKILNIIYSAVGAPFVGLKDSKVDGVILSLDHSTPLPILNQYGTKETLGTDRISNAVGAAELFPGQNVLVIDAGTCITLDIVDSKGSYFGGSISNGIEMRFKALNTFTENLPLIGDDNSTNPDIIGRSTSDSIKSGVINGVFAELCGMIDKYNEQFSDLKLILTGGDLSFIEEGLHDRIDIKKNEIFADPNLVHIGLNAILNFYVKSESY